MTWARKGHVRFVGLTVRMSISTILVRLDGRGDTAGRRRRDCRSRFIAVEARWMSQVPISLHVARTSQHNAGLGS
jgi:hypothetical protein